MTTPAPLRLVELPPEDGSPMGRAAELVRAAQELPARSAASRHLVRWRIRATLDGRARLARWVLRPALVALLLFSGGAVLGVTAEKLRARLHRSASTLTTPRDRSVDSPAPLRMNRQEGRAGAGRTESTVDARLAEGAAAPAQPTPAPTERSVRPGSRSHRSASKHGSPAPRTLAEATGGRPASPAPVPPEEQPQPVQERREARPSPPLSPPAFQAQSAPPPVRREGPDEQALFARALHELRGVGDARAALEALDWMDHDFPGGLFAPEASELRTEALTILRRNAEALKASVGTSPAALVIRGELSLSLGQLGKAAADFGMVLDEGVPPTADDVAIIERALWGRAQARARMGERVGARRDLEEYLRRFPGGRFAGAAERLLGEVPMIGTLFALTLAASDVATFGFGLVIASDSDCPTAAGVRDELRGLSFPSPDAASVAVHGDDEEVTVVFGAPAGLQRGPRKLALAHECDRRAASVALLIAAWLGQLSSRPPTMTLESLPPKARPRPAAPREPPAPTESTISLAGSFDAYPSEDSTSVAALALELCHGTVGTGPGFCASLSSQVVPSNQVGARWVRPALELDARWRIAGDRVAFDLAGGPALGAAIAWSDSSGPVNHQEPTVGLGAALRLAVSRSDLVPWLEVRGRLWSSTSTGGAGLLDYRGSSNDLPSIDVALALGWSRRGL